VDGLFRTYHSWWDASIIVVTTYFLERFPAEQRRFKAFSPKERKGGCIYSQDFAQKKEGPDIRSFFDKNEGCAILSRIVVPG
jgi:hypothetical protein